MALEDDDGRSLDRPGHCGFTGRLDLTSNETCVAETNNCPPPGNFKFLRSLSSPALGNP